VLKPQDEDKRQKKQQNMCWTPPHTRDTTKLNKNTTQ
jgi:hypothetical protein